MGVVVLIALLLGGGFWAARMRSLSCRYQQRAEVHSKQELLYLGMAKAHIITPLEGQSWGARPRSNAEATFGRVLLNERLAAYHAALKFKYRIAASRPWVGLTPDPPPPTFETIRPDLPRYVIAASNGQERLSLDGTDTTDADLKAIEEWTQLRRLDLSGTRVTDDGLSSLHKLDRLERLNLMGTKVSEDRIRDLARVRPNMTIDYGGLPQIP